MTASHISVTLIGSVIILLNIFPVFSQQLGQNAPKFEIYQYKDSRFNTDSVYGKKIVTFIFGSIT